MTNPIQLNLNDQFNLNNQLNPDDKINQDSKYKPVMQSPLHPFGLVAKQEKINDSKGVWANENALLGYISLRGNAQNEAFTYAVNTALSIALPTQACSMINTSFGSMLWLSTDEWLLICPREQRASIQQLLETALAGIHSQVLDNSGGFTSVILQGKNASDVLHHCTVYDLSALEAGKVVGTTFGKVSLFLHLENNGYKLIFRRSFADYIWRYLERSALPYGFGIALLNDKH